MSHQSVLLHEAINGLNIQPDGIYIDATFGRGGHSKKILQQLGPKGRLIAIDQDPEAISVAQQQFSQEKGFHIVHETFAAMEQIATEEGVMGLVNGILFDLGVSSPQLDNAERGFSFLKDGPLDMRMDNSKGMSAAEWLASVDEERLVKVLRDYGEERFARRIAKAIITKRIEKSIETTKELAEIVSSAIPKAKQEKHKHPATRSFQAIRIFINQELEAVETAIEQSFKTLCKGGRLVVISFHSLEDRIVKRFMRDKSKGTKLPKGLPIKESELNKTMKLLGRTIKASEQEILENNRARSAVLRIAEKIS